MHIVTLHSSGYLMDRIKTRELIHFTRRVTKKKKKKNTHDDLNIMVISSQIPGPGLPIAVI